MVFHEIETGSRLFKVVHCRRATNLTVVVDPARDSVRVVERLPRES